MGIVNVSKGSYKTREPILVPGSLSKCTFEIASHYIMYIFVMCMECFCRVMTDLSYVFNINIMCCQASLASIVTLGKQYLITCHLSVFYFVCVLSHSRTLSHKMKLSLLSLAKGLSPCLLMFLLWFQQTV